MSSERTCLLATNVVTNQRTFHATHDTSNLPRYKSAPHGSQRWPSLQQFTSSTPRALGAAVVTMSLCMFVFLAANLGATMGSISSSNAAEYGLTYQPITPNLGLKPGVAHSLAQYSPWYPVDTYRPPPEGCEVDQVDILQRHGARFPTSSPGKAIKAAVAKLKSASTYTDRSLDFVHNYTYNLGVDDLVPFGAMQSFDSGQAAYVRYHNLFSKKDIPFVRASDSTRVVQSAANWTAGFSLASNHKYNPLLSVIISESANNTLNNECEAAGGSDDKVAEWLAVFGPSVAARLNAGAPGANITINDLFPLLTLCAFDSVASEKASPWCNVFTAQEFEDYEYYADISKYYGSTGPAQPLGRIQGVGYVNELLARLTESPVVDHTQTNSTLDSSPETFPLNRSLYADFTHDNLMVAVFGALGLYADVAPLNTTASPDPRRSWRLSQLVPFSARMVTERLQCRKHGQKGAFVRVLVNERVQPLEFCGAGDGVCALSAFVKSRDYARHDGYGDYDKCFPASG